MKNFIVRRMSPAVFGAIACVQLGALTILPRASVAGEAGQSPYMSGYKDFLSGIIPQEGGLYLRDSLVYYHGSVARDEIGGRVVVNVHAQLMTNVLAPTYVTPITIFGGTYAFGAILPVTNPDISSNVQGPGFSTSNSENRFGLGDVSLTPAILGWSAGNFHWSAAFSIMAPTGDYRRGGLANTSLNRWSFLPQASVTYLDPNTGWNASAAFVFAASTENPTTHYQSGDFVHVDFAGGRYLNKKFQLGLVGYYEQQITGDSGSGALLGSYKARVWAIGPGATYTFLINQTPVTATAKWTHEFAVRNTFQGDAVTIGAAFKF